MRLARFMRRDSDTPAIGIVVGDGVVALSEVGVSAGSIVEIAAAGPAILTSIRERLKTVAPNLALADVRLLAPVEKPGKYLGIGMNYAKHAAEAERIGVKRPEHQLWFNKQTTCIAGPFDDIAPGVTEKLDYEVELGVMIGRPAKGVAAAQALEHVFGYFVANDVSARDWQFHSQTFTLGKSFDTHGPIGPWIVTADEIADPQALALRCLVNGQVRQSSDTSQMVFNIAQQIEYLSTAFTLETGDLIATGTPEGVGVGMEPPVFLQPGDVVRCEIDGIGAIENKVTARLKH